MTRQLADATSGRGAIDESLLAIATLHGDAAWADHLRSAYQQTQAPELRKTLLKAMTGFRDPALLRAGLDFALADPARPGGLLPLLTEDVDRMTVAFRFEWVAEHYDSVKKELPAGQQDALVWMLFDADEALLAKGRVFFGNPSRRSDSIEANLTEVEYTIKPAAAIRQRFGTGLSKYIHDRLAQPGPR